jgi:hypothetical protein
MLKTYLKIIALLALLILTYGFLGPFLYSYPNDLLVITGLLLMILVVPVAIWIVIKILLDFPKIKKQLTFLSKKITRR